MNLDRAVLVVAGTVVLLSLVSTLAAARWWLLLTAFGVPSGCAFTAPSRNPQRRVPSAHP